MEKPFWLVKRADHDAIVTIHPILDPEKKTFLRIDIPFSNSRKIR
jgi:hypothetical protein